LVDIDVIDLKSVGRGNGPGDGALPDSYGENFAALGQELFGIAEPADGTIGRKDNGGGENRTEEGAAPDLIDTGDAQETLGAGLPFVFALASHPKIRPLSVERARGSRDRFVLLAFAEARRFAL
jgi:hypothetical protein